MSFEQVIRPLINGLLQHSRLLAEHLKLDQSYLQSNNISLIEENNTKKIEVNNALLEIINKLDSSSLLATYSGHLFERVQQYAESLAINDKKWLQNQLKTLKEEILSYNQIMQVNRTIVNANLLHSKDLFCAILNEKNINEPSVYKLSGTPASPTISLE